MELVSASLRLDMKAGDLVELLESDSSGTASTSSAPNDVGDDVGVLFGRNESTGRKGSFSASCVHILAAIEKPTPDFIVSTCIFFTALCFSLLVGL